MVKFLKNPPVAFARKILFAVFLLCAVVFILPQKIIAGCSHIEFEYDGGNNNDCGLKMTDHDICCYPKAGGGETCVDKYIPAQCKPWQIDNPNDENPSNGIAENGTCNCAAQCLDAPINPKYYDIPDSKISRSDKGPSNVNLPVVLAWDNIRGWQNLGYNSIFRGTIPNFCGEYKPNPNNQGPQSYRVEIKYNDDPANGDPNLHIDTNKNPQKPETLSNGQKIFFKVIAKSGLEGFNSRDERGGECFFNSNTEYEWRVRPCCDTAGTMCKPMGNDEGWWAFRASPAPELLGITDKNHSGLIVQDPDWNGDKHLNNVNFCTAKLLWCKAKLVTDGSDNRFSIIYNGYGGSIPYAINYQMRVKFSENWSLGLITNTGINPVWQNPLAAIGASQKYLQQAAGNYLSQYLTPQVKQALNISDDDLASGESCHYLEKQLEGTCDPKNNGCCKPESVSFSSYLSDINTANQNFHPFFSASTKSKDRNLFTGDQNGDLIYSWQTKVCFDIPSRTDSSNKTDIGFPACAGYNNEDYGQKWKFSGEKFNPSNLVPPTLQSPPDNKTKNSAAPANLVGLSNNFLWSAPCGANSFVYDIQTNDGKSIFTDADSVADQGRRVTVSQLTLSLTDKDPVQSDNPEQVNLKINTLYRWHVKSCWPSIPTKEKSVNELCSDKWSDLNYFYTTGRKPDKTDVRIDAPNAALSWEDVSGRGSYRIKFLQGPNAPPEQVITTNQFTFTYLEPKKPYSWQVKTCTDATGAICGDWKLGKSFNSGDFEKPTNMSPSGNIAQLPINLNWSGAAKYYLVTASITNGEKSSSCDPDWFNNEYKEKKISGNSMAIKSATTGGSRYCSGDFYFKVIPCFDSGCVHLSTVYAEQTFSVAPSNQKKTGFMVCGQATDDLSNSYNEKEPCKIRHLFLTLKIIIEFVVFKLMFLLLPVLVLITGGLFYLAEDKSKLLPTIKDSWKKIGWGYLFLIFAWLIVSLLMMFAGYQNDWWKIL